MHILETLAPERCQLGLQASSRKKALQVLANIFSQSCESLDSFEILQALTEREQVGTTAIGNGIALPHGRLSNCEKPIAILATLDTPVDFFASDKENIDVMFALLIPKDLDFRDLAGIEQVKTIFDNKTFCAQIRNAHNNEALFDIIEQAFKEYGEKEKAS
ncbi:PTS sugar transporter subunit IIA [Kangiella sediminilitoris]|uniref:Putative PTS IIA-like nitrogen-regulatory protein PtsN n=1 Tax=Kangiella sediminilitoris TaxID=1144748 RepID=A0A1B3BCH0_9GAMM|nr:PTS sugar transporter subunit IIA [Kangiella sediminilitoris]AOE50506.1 Putative PTS IIA-like nitrogen-regulatory protein PtsN [Kangiella sediminilitoris]